MPFGSKQPGRFQAQPRRQSFPHPIPNTPVPLPNTTGTQSERKVCSDKLLKARNETKPTQRAQPASVASRDLPYGPAEAFVQDVSNPADEPAEEHSNPGVSQEGPLNDASANSVTTDQLQDAGGGKIRGPHGRFVPTRTPPKKKKARSSFGRRSKALRRGMILELL